LKRLTKMTALRRMCSRHVVVEQLRHQQHLR
jgi:hypothetical protein